MYKKPTYFSLYEYVDYAGLLTQVYFILFLFTFIGYREYLESVEHQTCTRRSAGNPVDPVYHALCSMATFFPLYTERRQKLPGLQPCIPLPVIHNVYKVGEKAQNFTRIYM